MILLHGEMVEGYHVEAVPQFNTDDAFTYDALSERAGIRAIWLLYYDKQWEHLEDIGCERSTLEPALLRFSYGRRLTIRQVQQLRKVPAVVAASRELRLAYALKYYDKNNERL